MKEEFSFNLTKPVAVLSENEKGYTKEVNYMSWNNADVKLDIRTWSADHKRCFKGITLSDEEGRKLYEALRRIYDVEPSVC